MKNLYYCISCIGIFSLSIACRVKTIYAQIIPDRTLGNENSRVEQIEEGLAIRRGARRRSNLFHSFRQFNVREGQSIYFEHSRQVENILVRVTGRNRSRILGTIGTRGNSEPNLFLINPNGIIFGPRSRLRVSGSFLATTASAIEFENQGFFNALDSNEVPLLTVQPTALLFNSLPNREIINRSNIAVTEFNIGSIDTLNMGLEVPEGKGILLIGGDVGLSSGLLTATRGNISIAAIQDYGEIGIEYRNNDLRLSVPRNLNFADITLTNMSRVTTEIGGNIELFARNVSLSALSQIITRVSNRRGGALNVFATDSIVLSGSASFGEGTFSSGLFSETTGEHNAGNMRIFTDRLTAQNGAVITSSSTTQSSGDAGRIDILAQDFVHLRNDGRILSRTFGRGNSGDIEITTNHLIAESGGQVSASTLGRVLGSGHGGQLTVNAQESISILGNLSSRGSFSRLISQSEGPGNAGNINILTDHLILDNGGQISTSTLNEASGSAGNLTIRANLISLIGAAPTDAVRRSGLFAVTSESTGSAGSLRISTRNLLIQEGAVVSTSQFDDSEGGSGEIIIDASESLLISGSASNNLAVSGIFTGTATNATAGNLIIRTDQLLLEDGAIISARTLSEGRGGNIRIIADELFLRDNARITAGRERGPREDASSSNLISEQSDASNQIRIDASSILLSNNGKIETTTLFGNGGDISLNVQELLLLQNRSRISTTAGTELAGGNGGDIAIATQYLIADSNSNNDITANAFEGEGGVINISAQGIFGITPLGRDELESLLKNTNSELLDPQRIPSSDITSISQNNPDLSGEVILQTPDTDPSRGAVELSSTFINVNELIDADLCELSNNSSFNAIGRGGLPPSPVDLFEGNALWQDQRLTSINEPLINPNNEVSSNNYSSYAAEVETDPTYFIEAQGWQRNDSGQVVLVAHDYNQGTDSQSNSSLSAPACQNTTRVD